MHETGNKYNEPQHKFIVMLEQGSDKLYFDDLHIKGEKMR